MSTFHSRPGSPSPSRGYVYCAHAACFAIIIGRDGDLCEDCMAETQGDPEQCECSACDNDSLEAR